MKPSPSKPHHVRFDEAGADRMDRTAVTVFAPIYPVIAEQIVARLHITEGRCVEIGSGPGLLSLALAPITGLHMTLLDAAMPMHRKARAHLSRSENAHRFTLLQGDVHHMPLCHGTIQLVVSRGSIFFWEDLKRAFKEIHRVLSPGGRAYVGGGFGSARLRARITRKMTAIQPDWRSFRDRNLGKASLKKIVNALHAAWVPHDIINDDSGFWIIIRKERES